MNAILTGYLVSQPAWLYLSSLLIIAVYYRFRRLWSLRNIDLLLLLSLSPGILLVKENATSTLGYAWLFGVTALCTLRLLLDGLFTNRARIDPNLNVQGMTFLCVCAFAFLMTEAVTRPAPVSSVSSVREGQKLLDLATGPHAPGNSSVAVTPGGPAPYTSAEAPPVNAWAGGQPGANGEGGSPTGHSAGPTASLLAMPVMSTSRQLLQNRTSETAGDRPFGIIEETAARVLAVLAHIAILLGLYWIGRNHFNDRAQGIGMATLYLLLPCTSYVVGEVNQVLPCAFILWALVCYSYPFWSGVLMGFACGSMFFPVFLLPVWASFFGWKRSLRFFAGVGLVALLLLGAIALISADAYAFTQQTINRIDFRILSFDGGPHETGFWTSLHPAYRIPVMVAFLLMVISLTVWPLKKSLEVLLAYSTAIIASTQFWYPQLGGVYVLWYLPLLIVVVFRPRLLAQKDYPLHQSRPSQRAEPHSGHPRTTGSGSLSFPLYR